MDLLKMEWNSNLGSGGFFNTYQVIPEISSWIYRFHLMPHSGPPTTVPERKGET